MPGTPDPHETESPSTQSVRESHNSGFQACIDAIPGVGDILSKCAEIGWKAVEEECCQYLLERLAGSPEEAERKFQIASTVDGEEQFHAGNEHYIFLPSDDVLLGDATPWNVRIVNRQIIPFVAVAENPSGEASDWCRQQAESKS